MDSAKGSNKGSYEEFKDENLDEIMPVQSRNMYPQNRGHIFSNPDLIHEEVAEIPLPAGLLSDRYEDNYGKQFEFPLSEKDPNFLSFKSGAETSIGSHAVERSSSHALTPQ